MAATLASKHHFLDGRFEWSLGKFQLLLKNDVKLNVHFDKKKGSWSLPLKFWIPVDESKEIKRALCPKKRCLEIAGIMTQGHDGLLVKLKDETEGNLKLDDFIKKTYEDDNAISKGEMNIPSKVNARVFVGSTLSLIFVIYRGEPGKTQRKKSVEEEYEDVFGNPENYDQVVFENPQIVSSWSLDFQQEPYSFKASNLREIDESFSATQDIPIDQRCFGVKIGFRLELIFEVQSDDLLRGKEVGTLHLILNDAKTPKTYAIRVTNLEPNLKHFKIQTTRCLKEFSGFQTVECQDFYQSLNNRKVSLYISSETNEITVRFHPLFEGDLWPYPSIGKDPTEKDAAMHLVFEAFRDYVDVLARTAYQRTNSLLLACQNPKLTVEVVKSVFKALKKETKEQRNPAHNTKEETKERNTENSAAMDAIAPLQESLETAIKSYEALIEKK